MGTKTGGYTMASSGQISGSTNYTGLAARMNWSQAKNTANNTSDITCEMQMRNTTGSYFSYGASWTLTLDGTAHSFSQEIQLSAEGSPWTTVWSKTYTVAHNADGTKTTSVVAAGSFTVGYYNGTVSIPQTTLTLDSITPIPPTPQITPATITSVTPVVKTDGTGSITIAINKPTGTQYCQAVITLGSYSQSVSMDSVTSYTYNVPAEWAGAVGSGGSAAGNVTLTTYREAGHTNSVGTATANFTAYRKCTISSVTPAVGVDGTGALTVAISKTNAMTYTQLTITLGSHTQSVSMDSQASYSYTIPASWADAVGSGGSAAGSVTLTTYTAANHATAIGTATASFTAYRKCTISSVTPAVGVDGTGALAVAISKTNAMAYAQLTITLGSHTQSVNMDSQASYSYTIPSAWADAVGSGGSAAGRVTLTTYTAANHSTAVGTATANFTAYRKCTISSVTQAVGVDGAGKLTVAISKANAIGYAQLTIALGGHSQSVSMDGQTSYSYTIPASWADAVGSGGSAAGSVTLTTYSAANHSTAIGTVTGSFTAYRKCTISSVTQAVGMDGTGVLTTAISKANAMTYAQLTIKLGNHSQSVSMDSQSSYSYTIPASWADAIGKAGYLAGSVTLTTYTAANHSTAIGTATASFTAYRKIEISSVTAKVGVDGNGVLTVTLARGNRVQYGAMAVSLGSHSSTVSLDGGQSQVTFTIPSAWADAVSSSSGAAGSVTVTSYTAANHSTAVGTATGSFTAYKAAAISSVTQKVILDGTGTLTVALNKTGASAYGQVRITLGSKSYEANVDSVSSLQYTIPPTWASEVNSTAQAAGTVKLTSYADSGHTVKIGEATASFTGYALCKITGTVIAVTGMWTTFSFEKPAPGVNLRVVMTLGTRSADAQVPTCVGNPTEYDPQERTARFNVPFSWGDQFPTSTTMDGTITLITYPDSSCTAGTELGSTTGTWKVKIRDAEPTGAENVLWLEQGSIVSGAEGQAANRVRSGWIKLRGGAYRISNGAGLDTAYALYDENKTHISDSGWQGTDEVSIGLITTGYIRVVWRRSNDGSLGPGDVTEPRIRFDQGSDLYGWAAAWQVSTNSTVSAWGKAVEAYSKIRVRVYPGLVNVSTGSGASFAGCRASVGIYDKAQHAMTQSGSYYEYTTGLILANGEAGIDVYAYDSRGFGLFAHNPGRNPISNTDDGVEVEAYSTPALSGVEMWRSGSGGTANEDGNYIWFKATLTYSSVGGKNSCTLKARYRAAGTQNWTEANLTSGTGLVLGGGALSDTTAYEAEITATDSVGNTKTVRERIPTKRISLHLRADNRGVGIGGYASGSRDDLVESQFAIHTTKDMEVGGQLKFDNAANIPYFNLGKEGTAITSGADLNDIYEPGNYYCELDTYVSSIAHRPQNLDIAFSMRVYKSRGADNDRIQEINNYWGYGMWRRVIRLYNNGTFRDVGEWFYYAGTQVNTVT